MNVDAPLSADQSIAAIAMLDLDPLKIKLMEPEDGPGWPRAKVDRIAIEYRRFLILLAKYPQHTIAPSKEVDKFWHAHILDTLKYAQDCETAFGYFVHHFPYFGMRGADDAANLAQAALTTAQLYALEFGVAAVRENAAYCGATSLVDGQPVFDDAPLENGVSSSSRTAYCGKANPAYCGKADPAYCGKAAPAYCGKATPAYCGKAEPHSGAGAVGTSAYCGRQNPASLGAQSSQSTLPDTADVMRTHIRPSSPE